MFGVVLVGLNVIVLLVTGHTLFQSIAMGLFYGLAMALVVVLVVAVWETVVGDSSQE
ncbi:hypothetical protein AArcMg_1376 [Natrarchaeobaculum sulfurireducens]|uniref:Uncharacterized protein n=2 Tax=Natrarchaeobaculum sulfurireducens TaxID=2044521 RepID=A0A346PPE6_9EURY|nr:hypothetical protein AArcMg_1376 [Natrarchaeobaculum sulfurireducens]